jgi:hypothetical protein
MNPSLLTSASAEDWFESINEKESLITNEEDKDKNKNISNANFTTMEIDKQNLKQNQYPPPPEGQLMIDSQAILANILMNIIAMNRKLDPLGGSIESPRREHKPQNGPAIGILPS